MKFSGLVSGSKGKAQIGLVFRLIIIPVWVGLACIQTTSVVAEAMDLSSCRNQPKSLEEKIRCGLWELTGHMHSQSQSDTRTTGRIELSPDRWASAEISTWPLRSSWPNQIRIRIYRHSGEDDIVTEDIRDEGMNGLNPDDKNDKFIRFSTSQQSVDLLVDRDEEAIAPVNEDYADILRQLVDCLRQPSKAFEPYAWSPIAEGLELANPKARRFIRLGRDDLTLLRIDPHVYSVIPYSFAEAENLDQASIQGWAEQLPEALALINSGQYYPDDHYIGIQIKNGTDWGTGLHNRWKAILLSGLIEGPENQNLPPSRILDLQYEAFDPGDLHYRFALQSFMLLDHMGSVRVRSSDRLASRSLIAQDRQGRILMIAVPGACSLYELALLLQQSDLDIYKAMSLDGGIQSQFLVRTEAGKKVVSGAWSVDERRQFRYFGPSPTLPAVLAVMPRSNLK